MRASSSSFSARSSRFRCSRAAPVRALSISLRRRSFISPAAFSVKVTATIRSRVPVPARTSPTIRPTRAVVLPVPAAASMKKLEPNSVRIRRRAIALARSVMAMPGPPEAASSFPSASEPRGVPRAARKRRDNRRGHIAPCLVMPGERDGRPRHRWRPRPDRRFVHVSERAAFRCGSGERHRWVSLM